MMFVSLGVKNRFPFGGGLEADEETMQEPR